MADQDIYDIMPHKEIADLKKQVSDLKEHHSGPTPELTKSMTTLTQSMDSLLHLFTEAAEELKLEDKEESELAKRLDPINKKLGEVLEQNRILAEGIVSLSDLVKDWMEKTKPENQAPAPSAPPAFQTAPTFNQAPLPEMPQGPPGQGIQGQAPPGMPNMGPPGQGAEPEIPFPELEEQPKKGIFGRLKK